VGLTTGASAARALAAAAAQPRSQYKARRLPQLARPRQLHALVRWREPNQASGKPSNPRPGIVGPESQLCDQPRLGLSQLQKTFTFVGHDTKHELFVPIKRWIL
jgi:hypothetical protein